MLNFSLLVNSGIPARLCVDSAVPKLYPIALLSMWNFPAFRMRCVEFMLDSLCQKSPCVKDQSCLVQTDSCGDGDEDFSLSWSCLQHRSVEAPEELVRNHLIPAKVGNSMVCCQIPRLDQQWLPASRELSDSSSSLQPSDFLTMFLSLGLKLTEHNYFRIFPPSESLLLPLQTHQQPQSLESSSVHWRGKRWIPSVYFKFLP